MENPSQQQLKKVVQMQSKKLYYLTNFFFSMATAGMLLQVPYFAQKRFAPSWVELAYLPAIFGLSYMVLAPLMGHIGSRSSRRGHFLSLGCLGVFLGSIVLFFAQKYQAEQHPHIIGRARIVEKLFGLRRQIYHQHVAGHQYALVNPAGAFLVTRRDQTIEHAKVI